MYRGLDRGRDHVDRWREFHSVGAWVSTSRGVPTRPEPTTATVRASVSAKPCGSRRPVSNKSCCFSSAGGRRRSGHNHDGASSATSPVACVARGRGCGVGCRFGRRNDRASPSRRRGQADASAAAARRCATPARRSRSAAARTAAAPASRPVPGTPSWRERRAARHRLEQGAGLSRGAVPRSVTPRRRGGG